MRLVLPFLALITAAALPTATPLLAATFHVPDSVATITAALVISTAGDTVLVEPGTYPESIAMVDGVALLAAVPGDRPVLDGLGAGTVVTAIACGPSTLVRGFTIRNGVSSSTGGGARLVASALTFDDCRFEDNSAVHGGGIFGESSSFSLEGCEFVNNDATESGGAISVTSQSSPSIVTCVLTGNEALVGGAIAVRNGCDPALDASLFVANRADQGAALWFDFLTGGSVTGCTFVSHEALTPTGAALWFNAISAPLVTECIVAFGVAGGAVFAVAGTSAALGCNDVFGNVGGDVLAGVADLGTNFSADPLFCDFAGGTYTLQSDSPCLPNGPCGLVGAFGDGNCILVSVGARIEAASWARIKARYRE